MDITKFTKSPIKIEQIQKIFNFALPVFKNGTLNIKRALSDSIKENYHELETIDKSSITDLCKEIVKWGEENSLWDKHPYGGYTYSLNAISFMQTNIGNRKNKKDAWQSFISAKARMKLLNDCDKLLFPFEIKDVFLFGSMIKENIKDFGDCDGVIVFNPKNIEIIDKSDQLFKSDFFKWAKPNIGFTSYRYVLEKVMNLDKDKFCSFVTSGKSLEVLYDHDKNFNIISINNIHWKNEIYSTQLDEIAEIVMQTQKNTDEAQKALVYSSINMAEKKYGGLNLENIMEKEVLTLLKNKPKDYQDQNFIAWFASLGGEKGLSYVLNKMDSMEIEQWREVFEQNSKIYSIWEKSIENKTKKDLNI